MGTDPKATRRAASQLERVAEAKLILVERRSGKPAPTSGAELLDRLASERGRE
jgi:hypothetical protein